MSNEYYPNEEYNRMNYSDFLNMLGLNNNVNMNMNMNHSYNNTNNNLVGTYEGYNKGNMFKNEYIPYKNYKPIKLIPNSEKSEDMLNLDQMHFAMHEANLYLDVYPNDETMMKKYVEFRNTYNDLLDSYQKKYGALDVNSNSLNDVPFGWEEEEWPWDRRGL